MVRALKINLSAYLRRVRGGEQVIITDHGKPCAVIQPFPGVQEEAQLHLLLGNPSISWNGQPLFLPEMIPVVGTPLSSMVLEERG